MKVKRIPKDDKISHWQQLYLQAKLDGNTSLMKKYEAILSKLGARPIK